MRCGASLPAVLAALIVTAVHAQGTNTTGGTATTGTATTGTDTGAVSPGAGSTGSGSTGTATTTAGPDNSCLFLGPTIGSNLLDIGWSFSGGPGAGAGFRVGNWLPNGFLAGEAGLQLQTAPFASSGYTQFSLKLGGLYGLDLGKKLGPADLYGLGGLDVTLSGTSSSSFSSFQPYYGLTLGGGVKYDLDKNWSVSCEAGLRTSLHFGSSGNVGLGTGLYVSMTGTWCPGECPYSGTTSTWDGPPITLDEPTGETPGLKPPDIVTHHDSYATPCSAYVTDGWIQPTQDVWQDDLSFDDKPGKQLTRLDGDAVAYLAELPMVTRKATLLFGVHHYRRAGAPVVVDSRDVIVLSGMTNCTTPRPVKLKFTLEAVGGSKDLWTSPEVGTVKLAGPPGQDYEPWSVRLPARDGIPPNHVFTIDTAGGYRVRAELLDAGNPTGLLMTVAGQALDMQGPAIHFVPVKLSQLDEATESSLVKLTEYIESDSKLKIPDVFPLPPGGLPTTTRVVRSLVDADVPNRWFEVRRISYLVAALNDTLAASAFLTGAGRVVAVLTGADFKSVFGTGAAGMTVAESVEARPRGQSARTLSWKVMLMPSYETWDTVAHEILHTLPEGWAGSEMQAECGKNYHNKKDPLAHGHRITEDSVAAHPRERKVAMISLMGPSVSTSKIWIDQCTYWHLTKQLTGGPPDPPVTLVRAMIGKKGSKYVGELRPVYDLGGYVDLQPGKVGPFAFVFRNAQGAELARFAFSPRATDIETGAPNEVMSYVGRVPVVPGWTQLELVTAGGAVLDRKVRSESPPQVIIEAPEDGELVAPQDGKVKVRWTGKGASPLLASVLYSADGGTIWTDQAFEKPISELDLVLEKGATDHLVKVMVTDGTRSGEAVIRFKTAAPK